MKRKPEAAIIKALKMIAEYEAERNEWQGRNFFEACVLLAQTTLDEAGIKYRPKFKATNEQI
jgi:hypothetical protein